MRTELPIFIIDIQGDGNHLLVDATVNSTPVKMLIDTGASRTVFDKTRLSQLVTSEFEQMDRLSTGLGTNTMSSEKIIIESLCFRTICFTAYEAIVLDLSHVNESYEKLGYEGISGVIGGDLLQKLNAVIDYKNAILILEE